MKPEPKSIFASQKDFGTRDPPRNPDIPTASSPKVLSSLSTVDLGIEREAGLLAGQSEPTSYFDLSQSAISSKNSGQSTGGLVKTLPASAFRKPDTPSSKALSTTTNTTNASKRPRSAAEDGGVVSTQGERPAKRNRTKLRPQYTIDPETFKAAQKLITPDIYSATSPLFFSNSTRQRPPLPSNHSSSEFVTTMINQARDEAGGIKTLKLARGSVSNTATPQRSGTPASWASFERSGLPQSPDARTKSPGMQILGSVGIIELLEQDERPTFIVDVANPVNFKPGGLLQIVFANASLRAYEAILEMVTGKEAQESPGIVNDFPEFKAWLLSFVKNNESLDICLPSFAFGGFSWTCSILRKRLRVISGSGNSIATGAGSSSGAQSNSSVLSERTRGPSLISTVRSPLAQSSEPGDYFGDAVQTTEAIFEHTLQHPLPSPMIIENLASQNQAMIALQRGGVTNEMMPPKFPGGSSFDWTRLPISAALPKHIQFARSIDWANTDLGPIENWSFDLRAMCNLIMGSPHPAAMYWGDELTAIYNEAYIMLAGQKHPKLMVST